MPSKFVRSFLPFQKFFSLWFYSYIFKDLKRVYSDAGLFGTITTFFCRVRGHDSIETEGSYDDLEPHYYCRTCGDELDG